MVTFPILSIEPFYTTFQYFKLLQTTIIISTNLTIEQSLSLKNTEDSQNQFTAYQFPYAGILTPLLNSTLTLDVQFTDDNCVNPILCVGIGQQPLYLFAGNSVILTCDLTGYDSHLKRFIF